MNARDGAGTGSPRPLRRAARLDGLFPADGTPESLGPILEAVAGPGAHAR